MYEILKTMRIWSDKDFYHLYPHTHFSSLQKQTEAALWRQRQENGKLEASLSYHVKTMIQHKTNSKMLTS